MSNNSTRTKTIWARLRFLVLDSDTARCGLLHVWVAGGWAYLLISPNEASTFGTSANFRAMSQISSGVEWTWGILFAFSCLFSLIAILGGNFVIRAGAALVQGIVWSIVTISFLQAAGFNTGVIVYSGIAWSSWLAVIRLWSYAHE